MVVLLSASIKSFLLLGFEIQNSCSGNLKTKHPLTSDPVTLTPVPPNPTHKSQGSEERKVCTKKTGENENKIDKSDESLGEK